MSDGARADHTVSRSARFRLRLIFSSAVLLGLLAGALISVSLSWTDGDGTSLTSSGQNANLDGSDDSLAPDADPQNPESRESSTESDGPAEEAAAERLGTTRDDSQGRQPEGLDPDQLPEDARQPDGWSLSREDPVQWYEAYTGPRDLDEAGLELRDGRMNIEETAAVIEGVIVGGPLHVLADDVTIRNVVVNGTLNLRESNGALIEDVIVRSGAPYPVNAGSASNWTLQYCEVDGLESSDNNGGLLGGDGTVRYCEFHSHTDSAKVGSNSVWEYNWLHSNGKWGTDAHVDGLQSMGASNVTVRRNFIDMPIANGANSAIIAQSNFGPIERWTVEENFLYGGNFTLFFRSKKHGDPAEIVIRNNRFGREHRYGLFSTQGDVAIDGNLYVDPVESANG